METVTLCGSRKFYQTMMDIKKQLERGFNIVHMPNFSYEKEEFESFTEEQFEALHEMHYAKMRQSDYVYIINVGGYFGEDTQREIDYAKEHGIPVKYLVDPSAPDVYVVTKKVSGNHNNIKIVIVGVFTDEELAKKAEEECKGNDKFSVLINPTKVNCNNWCNEMNDREFYSKFDIINVSY